MSDDRCATCTFGISRIEMSREALERFDRSSMHSLAEDDIVCRRTPSTWVKHKDDWCGEHKKWEVTK